MIEDSKEKLKELRKYYGENTTHLDRTEMSWRQTILKNKIVSMFDNFNLSELIDDNELTILKLLIDDCIKQVKYDKKDGYLRYLNYKFAWRCKSSHNCMEKEKIQKIFDDFYNREFDDIEVSELDVFAEIMQKFMWSKK